MKNSEFSLHKIQISFTRKKKKSRLRFLFKTSLFHQLHEKFSSNGQFLQALWVVETVKPYHGMKEHPDTELKPKRLQNYYMVLA